MSTARVDFTRGAAERIARVVRIVEQGERDQSGPTYGSVIEPPAGKVFRVGRFSGAWNKGQTATVTLRYLTNTPNTVTAINLFANIATSASTARACAIAKDGTAWHLIAAEC